MVIFWFSPRSCGRWSRFYIQMFFQPGFTKNFRYLKWGYWTLYGYFVPFWEWVFPYISLASSLYSFSYLHFRYQRNVNGDGLKSNQPTAPVGETLQLSQLRASLDFRRRLSSLISCEQNCTVYCNSHLVPRRCTENEPMSVLEKKHHGWLLMGFV